MPCLFSSYNIPGSVMAGSGSSGRSKGKGKDIDDFFSDFERPLNAVEVDAYVRELIVQVRGLKGNINTLEEMMNEAYETIADLKSRVSELEAENTDIRLKHGALQDKVRENETLVTFDTKTDTSSQLHSDTEDDAETERPWWPGTDDTKTCIEADTKADTETDTTADTKTYIEADTKADTTADTKADTETERPKKKLKAIEFQGFSDSENDTKADTKTAGSSSAWQPVHGFSPPRVPASPPAWGATPRTPTESVPAFPPVDWGLNPVLGPVEDLYSHL